MGAINCNISCCDLLDIAYTIVNQKRYGLQCSPILYCNFSKYYQSHADCPELIDESITNIDKKITVINSAQFVDHVCLEMDIVEPETYWAEKSTACEILYEDGQPVGNTGNRLVSTLWQYYSSNDQPTGQTKFNIEGDPDYIAPYPDPVCYITYHMCEEAQPYFTSMNFEKPGLLSVGNLVATGYTIGNYKVNWHKGAIDGSIVLTSGVGDDTVQATHPFVDEPLQGGTLYPEIEYVYIDGIKYTNALVQDVRYSPDLATCLDSITVTNFNCSNGTLVGQTYTHVITYVNNINPANDAERTFRFDLSTDGSTNYFAWRFVGYTVTDRLTISYVSMLDEQNPVVVSDWIIGTNANSTNFVSNPKRWGSGYQELKSVVDLSSTPYTDGDYLLLHVTPRVDEPTNSNTNWTLQFKCLSSFNCTGVPVGYNKPNLSTLQMAYDAVNCKYTVDFDTLTSFSPYIAPVTDIFNYFTYQTSVTSQIQWSASHVHVELLKNTTAAAYAYNYNNSCQNLVGGLTINKVGNILTFEFTSNADYLIYKNAYNATINNPALSGYTPDNTLLDHYRFFLIYAVIAESCGDTSQTIGYYMHWSSVFTWNDLTNTLQVTLASTTNGIVDSDCNNTMEGVAGYISLCNNTISQPNGTKTTKTSYTSPIGGIKYVAQVNNQTDRQFFVRWLFAKAVVNGICDLTTDPWCDAFDYYFTAKTYIRVQITNQADPLNNWRLQTALTDQSCQIYDLNSYITIYEIINGVETQF